jgi:hypothetical protein
MGERSLLSTELAASAYSRVMCVRVEKKNIIEFLRKTRDDALNLET